MLIDEVLLYPDPRLRQKSVPVTEFGLAFERLVDRLQMHLDNGPPSVGIAAPQIGEFVRVAVVDVSSMFADNRKRKPKGTNNGRMVLVNPEVTQAVGEQVGREGCLSVPDYTGNVLRPESIQVSALDVSGERQQYDFAGFEARAVLHELDHLEGILFLDRVVSPREVFRRKVYK